MMRTERTSLHDELLAVVLDDKHGWRQDVLRAFGRKGFLESGDIACDNALNVLIDKGLVYRVIHIDPEVNTPDYGITQLGREVFELVMIGIRAKNAEDSARAREERLRGWIN